jgi:hypothetical protein
VERLNDGSRQTYHFLNVCCSLLDLHRGLSRDKSFERSLDLDELPTSSTLAPVGGGKEIEYFFASDARYCQICVLAAYNDQDVHIIILLGSMVEARQPI